MYGNRPKSDRIDAGGGMITFWKDPENYFVYLIIGLAIAMVWVFPGCSGSPAYQITIHKNIYLGSGDGATIEYKTESVTDLKNTIQAAQELRGLLTIKALP